MTDNHSWTRRSFGLALLVAAAVTLAGYVLPESGTRTASSLHCNHGRCPDGGGDKTCIWGPYMQCHFLSATVCDTGACDTALEP